MHDLVALDGLHVGGGFVGAQRTQRHGEHVQALGAQRALGKQALAQRRSRLHRQVHQHVAAARLCARVDAGHAGFHRCVAAFNPQQRSLAHAHLERIAGADGGLQLHAAQVHDFDDAGVDGHALARLGQALRHHAGNRRLQHRIVQRLAGHVGGGQGRLVGGACGIQAGHGGVQRGFRDEALVHQRLVVVELPLGNVDLRPRGIGLVLCLPQARPVFRGLDARNHLAGLHRVALAYRQALQFAGNAGLQKRRVHGLERAGDRQALREFAGLGAGHVAGCELHHRDRLGRAGCGQRLLLRLARHKRPPDDRREDQNHQQGNHPLPPAFHWVFSLRSPRTIKSACWAMNFSGSILCAASQQGAMECFHITRKISGAMTA